MSDQPKPPADYHRPQQTWVCGRTCQACQLGPTRFGSCRDREQPCRPQLSLRGKRALFVLGCTLTTVAVLLIGTWQTWSNQFISPGEITSVHQQATHDFTGGQSCDACHDPQAGDLIGWLKGDVPIDRIDTQSERCLKCHDSTFSAEQAFAAHNLAPDALAKITQAKAGSAFDVSNLLRVKMTSHNKLACATCHQEHRGAKIDLTTMTDRQCQSCHQQYVHSFEGNHPEFRLAEKSRSRIAFDHASHVNKHFKSKQKEVQCSQCHVDDLDRNVKLLANFEQTCAQCHQQPIQAALTEGVTAFALPTLNAAKLKEAGMDIGSWPSAAEGEFDGTVSAFTLTLLQADEEAAEVFQQWGYELDFAHLPTETKADLQRLKTLAWSYKRLLHELAVNPEETIRRRLEKVAGNKLSSADWERVSRTLPPALFREAARRWFPQLEQELAQQANQRPPREASLLQPEVFRNEKHVAQEMLAENPLAKIKPTVAKAPSVIPGVTWWNQKETLPKAKASAPAKSDSLSKEIVDAPTEPPAKKPRGELLAVNPLRDLLQRSPEQAASPQSKAPQSLSSALPEDAASVPPARVVEVPSEPVAVANNPPPADTIDLVNHGAWFLDESSLSVRYRPRGHADEWLQLVLNAAAASQSQPPPQRASLFAKTLSETAFQSCASCHSIEQTTTAYRLHWQAGRRDLSRREFTKFSHRPHTLQPQLENCTHCHAVNANAQAMLNYETPHPKRIVDDFHPLQKASCIACHSSATDGGRCTLCHNYHVGAKKHPGH